MSSTKSRLSSTDLKEEAGVFSGFELPSAITSLPAILDSLTKALGSFDIPYGDNL